jgi:hypothetical protein
MQLTATNTSPDISGNWKAVYHDIVMQCEANPEDLNLKLLAHLLWAYGEGKLTNIQFGLSIINDAGVNDE